MRVIIFPTSTGQGHNQASKAVKEYLDSRGVETIISDVLDSGKKKSDGVSKLYDWFVNRAPHLFGALYAIGEHISSSKRHSPIYYLNTLYTDSLYQTIQDIRPDVIVCPHIFSAQAVTRLIEKKKLNIPTVGLITDYCWSPFWEETRFDRYVVPNTAVAEEFVAHGLRPETLVPLGIPVSAKFGARMPKEEARAVFGIPNETVFVINGGSMGYGKIPELAAELARRMPEAGVFAVCGHNTVTYDKVRDIKGVTALRFVENIDVLLDAADVLLTKPGGLSTTEAIVKRLPLVITMPIPGGEERNAAFFARTGMAVSAKTVGNAADAACRLASDDEARRAMREAQERNSNVRAAKDIGDLIISLAK